jgi:hypothetical protein
MATLKIDRGTTFPITVNYTRGGVATTLVGATVRFTMKSEEYTNDFDDSDASVQKNVTNGTAEGSATITLNPADTAQLTPGDYFYDIKVQESGGSIYKIDEGKVVLGGSPTNRLS